MTMTNTEKARSFIQFGLDNTSDDYWENPRRDICLRRILNNARPYINKIAFAYNYSVSGIESKLECDLDKLTDDTLFLLAGLPTKDNDRAAAINEAIAAAIGRVYYWED